MSDEYELEDGIATERRKIHNLLELILANGDRYMINMALVACISSKKFQAIGDLKGNTICTIHLLGGGTVRIEGGKYEEICQLWHQKLATYYGVS